MNVTYRTILIIILLLIVVGFVVLQPRDVAEAPDIIYNNASEDIVSLISPQSGTTIQNPVTISGTARGIWYFEATFPIVITDWSGEIVGEGFATAQDNWMTEDFVPFEGTIHFETPDTDINNRGTIILQQANAKDDDYESSVEIPIQFQK